MAVFNLSSKLPIYRQNPYVFLAIVVSSDSFFGRDNPIFVNSFSFFVYLILSVLLYVGRFNFCKAGQFFFSFRSRKSKLFDKALVLPLACVALAMCLLLIGLIIYIYIVPKLLDDILFPSLNNFLVHHSNKSFP